MTPGDAERVPFGFRPVQDRHRPVEFAHDGADDGGAAVSSTRSPATTGRARPAPRSTAIGASLHGSLAYTGIGHGTDRAVVLGLAGLTPQTVDPDEADAIVAQIAAEKRDRRRPAIRPIASIRRRIWCSTARRRSPAMPTAWRSTPIDRGGRLLLKRIYYSIGGGFVVSEEELQRMKAKGSVTTEGKKVPYPFKNAVEMLAMAAQAGSRSPT